MVSIVIPVLNEEAYISNLLSDLVEFDKDIVEIIVVDGGSEDDTKRIVSGYSRVQLFSSERGRAIQMNFGASRAKGKYLFFLHADSRLSDELKTALPTISSEAATFKMKFDANTTIFKFYSWFTKLNLGLFTYGDQGLWITKQLFESIEGFKQIPILEDVDIIRRIKKKRMIDKLPYLIITSARRFRKNGVLFQQLLNIMIVLGYYLGLSPYFLARFYKY